MVLFLHFSILTITVDLKFKIFKNATTTQFDIMLQSDWHLDAQQTLGRGGYANKKRNDSVCPVFPEIARKLNGRSCY